MVDRHPVTYDSTKEDAFIVHLPHKQVKFTWENGLYVYRPPYVKQPVITKLQPTTVDNQAQFLETVDENKKFYTKRHQFEWAKAMSPRTTLFSWISIHQRHEGNHLDECYQE
jgi:hypothetical protein